MDHLHVKQDLETFSQDELDALAKYYNISIDNHNDSLWLIAIKNLSEYKRANMPPIDKSMLEKMPIDALIPIISNLKFTDIYNLCKGSKTLNEKICKSKEFWMKYAKYTASTAEEQDDLFYEAVDTGSVALVRALLELGVKPEPHSLSVAIDDPPQPEIVKLLLDVGVDPDGDDGRPLNLASQTNNITIIKSLLDAGAKVGLERAIQNIIRFDPHGFVFPAGYVANLDKISSIKLLLDAGADPNIDLRGVHIWGGQGMAIKNLLREKAKAKEEEEEESEDEEESEEEEEEEEPEEESEDEEEEEELE